MVPLFPPNDEMCAFLRAIKEAPEDDAPRLIFADYLEENGHPERAQFIRVQCALAVHDRTDRELRTELHPTIEPLFHTHASEWLGPWGERVRRNNRRFSRGLVDLVIHASALVSTMQHNPDPRHFAWVERLRILSVGHPNAAALPDYLVQIPDLRDLSFVDSWGINAAPAAQAFRLVWHSRAMNTVEYLELDAIWQTEETLLALLQSPQWHRLRTLHLHHCFFLDELGLHLADRATLPTLHTLRCSNCHGTTAARTALRQRFGERVWHDIVANDDPDSIPF